MADSAASAAPAVHAITDDAVDAALDGELRTLLSTCFTGPNDHVFRERRFFREPPRHRWFCRDAQGLTAHVAAHVKTFRHAGGGVLSAGIAEVCVRPDQRGRGLVRLLLTRAHADLAALGLGWSALFGDARVYASSGYAATGQPLRHRDRDVWVVRPSPSFLVARLRADAPPWPTGELDLGGPAF